MPENVNDPSNASVKPGWRSSEAWLTLAAQIIGAFMYSGLLSADDPTEAKILKFGGIALAILSAIGYQAQRGWVKTTTAKGAALTEIAKHEAGALTAAAVSGAREAAMRELLPLMQEALRGSVGGSTSAGSAAAAAPPVPPPPSP